MNNTEFSVKYKGFTLFIYETVEDDNTLSYLGECKKLIYRWRQEGKRGFFRIVKNFKYEVDNYLGENND